RPEALAPNAPCENALTATVERMDFEGAFGVLHGRFADGAAMAAAVPGAALAQAPVAGTQAAFGFRAREAVVLPDG
ncbi:MAG: TOBE domain-containing protein, partial [Rubrimonas sp.]